VSEETLFETGEFESVIRVNEDTFSLQEKESVIEENSLQKSKDIDTSPSGENIDTKVEVTIDAAPAFRKIGGESGEAGQVMLEIDAPDSTPLNMPEVEISFPQEDDIVSVDPEIENQNSFVNNNPEPVSPKLEQQPVKQKLSPELAKRIITRLEFFSKAHGQRF